MMPELGEYRCLVFDVYGTLVDWEAGIWNGLQPLRERSGQSRSREETLRAFVHLETVTQTQQPTLPYKDVLAKVYRLLATEWDATGGEKTEGESRVFAKSIEMWEPFPDTVDALVELSKHFKLVVLSNVDRDIFEITRQHLEVGMKFDRVCTAQDIGTYKPDVNNFKYALEVIRGELGIEKEGVLVTAQSLYHDHAPANKLGLASVWIDRAEAVMGSDSSATYDFRFDTLGEMVKGLLASPTRP